MPFSHHSHSGQFCHHARNTLEEMIQAAISKGFSTLCLTEHMPRGEDNLYEEETVYGTTELGHTSQRQTSDYLFKHFDDFFHTALDLKRKYQNEISLFVGMEIEWIDTDSNDTLRSLFSSYSLDLFIGSVHFVRSIPIDYSKELYQQAIKECGGSWLALYEEYFDIQYMMLQTLKPPIVGHFDLIRLKNDQPDASLRGYQSLWAKILRNIDYVVQYQGLFEINTAALRKGLLEPYPSLEICKEIVALRGKFTISDDAHAVDQIGTNYEQLPQFLEKASIETIHCWSDAPESSDRSSGGKNRVRAIAVAELNKHAVFRPANDA